jgi:hypothetical protein
MNSELNKTASQPTAPETQFPSIPGAASAAGEPSATTATTAAPGAGPSPAELQEQLDAARAELAAIRAEKAAQSAEEVLILARMKMGINRKQATAAVKRQKEFDASPHGQMCRARFEARQNHPCHV